MVSTTGFFTEIEELKKSVKSYESRIDYLEECLEETGYENQKLTAVLDERTDKLTKEQHKTNALSNEIAELKTRLDRDRRQFEQQLDSERESGRKEMYAKVEAQRKANQAEINQRMDEAREGQYERLRQQKQAEEARIKELIAKQQQKADQERQVVVEVVPQDTDTARLVLIEKKQSAEIARLRKKLEQLSKLSDMKVKKGLKKGKTLNFLFNFGVIVVVICINNIFSLAFC